MKTMFRYKKIFMPKFNDLDLKNWKEIDLNMDSLWIIPERKKWWKHSNFYHWNFVPQIPEHFIKRYTKKWGWVFDPFLWSATTTIEAENLDRNIVWVDIQEDLIKRSNELIWDSIKKYFIAWDSADIKTRNIIKWYLEAQWVEGFDLAILHPPYADIIKFSDKKEDLSNCKTIDEFLDWFEKVLQNTYDLLKKWWYCVVVIWDKYQNSEWIPLGFKCMERWQKVWFKLKSIIVKNMEWNRWKLGTWWIWRYRALSSDYYLFKHEYILVFKKR